MIPRKGFLDYLISLWWIFMCGKKTWHPTFQCVNRFEQICEAGDGITLLEGCTEEQYVLNALVYLHVALFWVACLCGFGQLVSHVFACRMRNVLTFLECASSLMQYVSMQFTVRHSRDTHVVPVLPLAVSCVIWENLMQQNCHHVGVLL